MNIRTLTHWTIILSCYLTCTTSLADELNILVTTEQIQNKTGDIFYDGSYIIDIDGDNILDSTLQYSYSKFGPASTCDDEKSCTPETSPVITAYIDLPNGRSHINLMCTSLGIYKKKSNGVRDLYCGPGIRLQWSGKDYIESDIRQ